MAAFHGAVAHLWGEVSRAIQNKRRDRLRFDRFYIGRLEPDAHKPVHSRSSRRRVLLAQREDVFMLSEPLSGIMLTRREVQVLFLICQGFTNGDAALRMHLSVRTTEYYIKNMRKKIAANSKAHLVRQVIETDFMQRVDASVLEEVMLTEG